MKLLLDEDSQGNVLVKLLITAGHDIETVTGAGLSGQDDANVLDYSRRTRRILLTRNGRDFIPLHHENNQHSGILIEHQDADFAKNMSYVQIVTAIDNLDASGWDMQGEIVGINAWQ